MNEKNKGRRERQEVCGHMVGFLEDAQRGNNISILRVEEIVSERFPNILKVAEDFVKDVMWDIHYGDRMGTRF
jgi:hypothetical protein